jgi:hypothetical protein
MYLCSTSFYKWCTFEESAADTVHVLASVAQMLLATRRHPENRIKKKKRSMKPPPLSLISLLYIAKSMRKSVGKKTVVQKVSEVSHAFLHNKNRVTGHNFNVASS